MTESRFFAGLCFGTSISALQVLSCRDDDELQQLCSKRVQREATSWLSSFAKTFRARVRQLDFDASAALSTPDRARRLLREIHSGVVGSANQNAAHEVAL